MARKGKQNGENGRGSEAEETRENIIAVATREFADKGLAGARIDEIADQTATSKRMIYYHFGSKEGLYRAVLEQAYGTIRGQEAQARFETMPADEAMRALVGHTFDYHTGHPEFVRLVMNENIHHGDHIGTVPGIKERNRQVINTLRAIIDTGVSDGLFRDDIDPVHLHMSISSLCFYNVSNRYTFSYGFGVEVASPKMAKKRRAHIIEMILAWCRKT